MLKNKPNERASIQQIMLLPQIASVAVQFGYSPDTTEKVKKGSSTIGD